MKTAAPLLDDVQAADRPIPFLDLQSQHRPLMPRIRQALEQVMATQAFALGPAVEQFEEKFAEFCGVRHCVGLNSGTSAVQTALMCAGVQPGDEVITTPYSWISTCWAISYLGATPVFVDIDPHTHCLDPGGVEAALTSRTAAILPVHLFGHPADMDPILEIAGRHGIPVVEDAAQAHGARYRGQRCGGLADIAAFSFYPGKNLGAFGEAGAVLTNHREWADRARRLRDHAQHGRHRHVEIGFNFRMDGMQAAVLAIKLEALPDWNERRRQVAQWYAEALYGLADLQVPQPAFWANPAWHLYAVRHPNRDALGAHLRRCHIATAVHYPTPIHLQPAYAHLDCAAGTLPHAETLARTQLSLPMFPDLSREQVQRIAEALDSFRG